MAIFRAVVSISDPSLGGTGVNVFHGNVSSDEDENMNTLMGHLETFYQDISDIFPSTTTLSWDGSGVTIDNPSPELLTGDDPWSVVGTGGTHPTPPATCIVVGWQTALRSRSGRGRTFLGPLDRDQVQDNGTPYEETRSMIVSAAEDLIAANGSGPSNVLGVWSPTDDAFRTFKSAAVANKFAVLRSRRD